ncbi:hypothetical protein C8Q73DRAFT_425303 [Cubamyces lactineus]|nr:hypothetical protein C8Q73DRAFT_425303 [Cubamyces lactineus]
MKHLRRNRSTSISTPCASSSNPPSVSAPAPLSARAAAAAAAERTSHEAPLYARFAGARRAPDGSGPSLKPLVSAPLALAPRKVVQVAVPVPAPGSVQAPAMKQQKSSEGRDRDRDRDVRGEVEKAKSRSEMRHEASQDERLKVSEHGRDRKDSGVGAQEMRRMPSEGTALSGESSSGNASASGVVLGRHGTRVEGDRVLLPARKVTRKRVDTTASGSSSRPDETRPVEGTSDETGAENGRGAASSARKARRERERERQWEREQGRRRLVASAREPRLKLWHRPTFSGRHHHTFRIDRVNLDVGTCARRPSIVRRLAT